MKFKGIIPALVTPLNEDETINTSVLVELINYLNSKGADGFYIGGATGEGLALRTEERMVLAQEAVNAINGKKPSIIQVASTDFNDAILLAKHAEKIGADAISATPPLFFQYDENDVYNYYKALADSVHIPVMIYYSPAARFDISADFAAKMFEALYDANINIHMIGTSEIKVSVLIDQGMENRAVKAIHDKFELGN
jgi:dihydrodipicolinate synthase/N-acetylneuraminate lyase